MTEDLTYVEQKTGYDDDGPAWIVRPTYSKSRSTVYVNGMALKRSIGGGVKGNYFEQQTGFEYWVSGVKKNGFDRRYSSAKIFIDAPLVEEYLFHIGLAVLPKDIEPRVLLPSKPTQEHHNSENAL